jgi:hypothetical protein
MKELKETVKIGEGDGAKEVVIVVKQPANSVRQRRR